MQTCGFVRGNVLCELGPHSLLVLECMVYYTKRFPCVAVRTNFSVIDETLLCPYAGKSIFVTTFRNVQCVW